MSWVDNLAQTGALLIGVGIAVELASRMTGEAAYRAAVGLALGSALLLGWVNSAVGIIGSEDNEANLMYGGVLVFGSIGAMSRVCVLFYSDEYTNPGHGFGGETMTGNAEKGGRRRWSRWRIAGWAVGAFMLLLALVAKQFIGEVSWVDNLAQTGALLIGVGIAVELASRKTGEAAYRAAVGLALGSALLLGWVNGAVGIIGSADNKANLMYGGVLVVGAIGAIIARFKPEGMARVLFATALAQTLVAVIALVGRLGMRLRR